jgi:hypothetical protein
MLVDPAANSAPIRHRMKTYSQWGIWARGALITVAAVLTYLTNDPTFRASLPPLWLTYVGAVAVAAIAIRGFIDQSPAQAETQAPVEVTAKKPLPVKETPAEPEDAPSGAEKEPQE